VDYEETFSYDGLGRMLTAEKTADTVRVSLSTFEYNDFGLVSDANEVIGTATGVLMDWDYDQAGFLTDIGYPGSDSVDIAREALGRISSVSVNASTMATYQYAGAKVVERRYSDPNVYYRPEYNSLGQMTRCYYYKGSDSVLDLAYTYDNNGNITRQKFAHRGLEPSSHYSYDDLDRLTLANYLLCDVTNECATINSVSVTYDAAGNMTADHRGYSYAYDYENRLVKITEGPATIAEFTYDALGRRIQAVANSTTTRYYYGGWHRFTQ